MDGWMAKVDYSSWLLIDADISLMSHFILNNVDFFVNVDGEYELEI